ncbi:MAG: MiaB/RimO family radical SAM methylthiotransferase [Candidatus Omnitrophica bacterium]|jgi:ribosomal protein S12 methylthiotransferase|nr:MiaB/RimO family radical SAM methylthiotransferase [Candidatus Omnitrophota bacterium]
MSNKVGLVSLGCPRNLVDSENIAGRLVLKGYKIVDIADADIGLINTCAFIQSAKQESIEAILDLVKLKKQGKLKKIIVCGCLTQRYREELKKQLPEVDAFVGVLNFSAAKEKFRLTPASYAYLKICEGCINHCSYCVIPRIKGKFKSLPKEYLLKRAGELDQTGVSELNIIGQDITGYGLDIYRKFALTNLVKQVSEETKNIKWIRLLYLNPERIDDQLISLIKEQAKICKYVDMPLQHINRRLLKLMRRPSSRLEILRLIEKIRKAIPDVTLRTSVIVGFPSETEKEFAQLLDFIKEVKFQRLGAFTYSREEGTLAYNLAGQLPESVKQERFAQVMAVQQKVSEYNNRQLLGSTLEVLIEEEEHGVYLGRSQADAPEVDGLVYVHSAKKLSAGSFVKVKITDTLEYDLVGEA